MTFDQILQEGHQPATFDLHPPLRRRKARLKVETVSEWLPKEVCVNEVFVGEADVWRTKILFEFKHLQVSEEYGDLEKLSESELMEILKSLEADEANEENLLEEVFGF